jgi:hypothetical protein
VDRGRFHSPLGCEMSRRPRPLECPVRGRQTHTPRRSRVRRRAGASTVESAATALDEAQASCRTHDWRSHPTQTRSALRVSGDCCGSSKAVSPGACFPGHEPSRPDQTSGARGLAVRSACAYTRTHIQCVDERDRKRAPRRSVGLLGRKAGRRRSGKCPGRHPGRGQAGRAAHPCPHRRGIARLEQGERQLHVARDYSAVASPTLSRL